MEEFSYSQYSVYNAYQSTIDDEHPLRDVVPESKFLGIHLHRNLLKPLNHLEVLREKEKIACTLNLHNQLTEKSIFDTNFNVLEKYNSGTLSTDAAIDLLYKKCKAINEINSKDKFRKELKKYASICHMEFHPTDLCNLKCDGCTYGHDSLATKPPNYSYPFDQLINIKKLNPKSIVIIGGGEPTLYTNDGFDFTDMINEIKNQNKGILLGLVTNGTYKPPGDWPDHFKWLRVSLDSCTPETYKVFRGKNLFYKVINNFLDYLDSSIRSIGVSFLYSKTNIHEYVSIVKFMYEIVMKENPKNFDKVNIQFRPLRIDPSSRLEKDRYYIQQQEIDIVIQDVLSLIKLMPNIKDFIKYQTNISAILGGNYHHPHEFKRCYYSQIFHIVRANGDIFPCFIRVNEPDFKIGNIVTDSLEKIALNTLYISAKRKRFCDPVWCRQSHVNYVLEKGLSGELYAPDNEELKKDLFF